VKVVRPCCQSALRGAAAGRDPTSNTPFEATESEASNNTCAAPVDIAVPCADQLAWPNGHRSSFRYWRRASPTLPANLGGTVKARLRIMTAEQTKHLRMLAAPPNPPAPGNRLPQETASAKCKATSEARPQVKLLK
jgi:hypothetical protein